MKTYIYTTDTKYGKYGRKLTHQIYRVKKNIPCHIAELKEEPRCSMGTLSEIYNHLIEIKELTKPKNNNRNNNYYISGNNICKIISL